MDFGFHVAVWGIGRCPIGLVAPCRFKIIDSQPGKSNIGPVPIDVHDVRLFRRVGMASWPGIYRVFGPTVPESAF